MESSNNDNDNNNSKRPRRHLAAEIETMESRSRKRREGDADGEERAVTEAEVEEFYAILRGVREARRLGGKARRAEEETWQPQFAWEDFQYYHAGCNADDDGKNKTTAAAAAASAASAAAVAKEEKIEKVFDLNVQPAAGLGDY